MRKCALWATAIALTLSTAARAQDIRVQERTVDLARARVVAAQARVTQLEDSLARAAQNFDTFTVGSLRVLVHPRFRTVAEAAARNASARLTAAAPKEVARLATVQFAVRPWSDTSDAVLVSVRRPGRHDRMDASYIRGDSATLTEHFVSGGKRYLATTLDARLRVWAQGMLLPDTTDDASWLQYRVALVSANSFVARNCYGGDMRACVVTLGLAPTVDPIMEWYDAADRRAIVRREMNSRPGHLVQSEQCVAGDDLACADVMHNYLEYQAAALVSDIRESLVSVALQLGGTSAYDRLLTASGTPAQQIETAATVPVDSVIRVWQRHIHETRLPSDNMSLQIAVASLFWIGLCGGLSLRSTRWR